MNESWHTHECVMAHGALLIVQLYMYVCCGVLQGVAGCCSMLYCRVHESMCACTRAMRQCARACVYVSVCACMCLCVCLCL